MRVQPVVGSAPAGAGGGDVALGPSTVGTVEITDESIDTVDVALGAVTLELLAPVPAGTVLANGTGGAAAPQALSATELRALLDLSTVDTADLAGGAVTTDKILNGTIVNGDISGVAAIDATKVAPDVSAMVLLQDDTSLQAVTARLEAERQNQPGWPGRDGKALRGARAGWNLRWYAPFNIGINGDSITQGFWSSNEQFRWWKRLLRGLYGASGQPYSAGYVSMSSGVSFTGEAWSFTGTTADAVTGWGYGGRFLSAGSTASFTFTGDRFWLFYQSNPTVGGAPTVTIDGVAVGTGITVTSFGSRKGGQAWDSGALSFGSHTVVVTAHANGSLMEGGMFFAGNGNASGSQGTLSAGDALTGAGVRVWPAGRFGYHTGDFAAAKSGVWWTDGTRFVNPHVMVWALGTNDLTAGNTPAQVVANFEAAIAQLETERQTSFVTPTSHVMMPHARNSAGDNAGLRRRLWKGALDNGWAVYDWQILLGDVHSVGADEYLYAGFFGDYLHLVDKSQRAVGEGFTTWFLDQVGRDDGITQASFTSYVAVGGAPAQSGGVRLSNSAAVAGRQVTAAGDVAMLQLNSSDNTVLAAVGGKVVSLQVGAAVQAQVNATGISLPTGKNLQAATSGAGTKIGAAANQLIGFWNATPRVQPSGWAAATGTATRTSFATSTVTLEELAQRVKAIIDDDLAIGIKGA